MEPTSDIEIPTRIDRFEVTGIVGRGGMGAVFRAFDPNLQRAVAIKVLHGVAAASVEEGTTVNLRVPGSGSSEQLLIEARALAQIAHPNVLAVHEIGTDRGQTFLVMELVDGLNLRGWLAAAPRTLAEIRRVFVQAADGLAAAHAHQVVHRDFKPDNLLISSDGRVRVADFGLATLVLPASSMVRIGASGAGTPAYMAPELWQDQPATSRSDIFAFAMTLLEAVLGKRPAAGTAPAEVDRALATRGVERALRAGILRGVAADPNGRPASIRGLAAVLEGSPRRTAVWIAGGAGACVLAGVAAAFAFVSPDRSACEDSAARVAARWNDGQRATVRDALARLFQMKPDEITTEVTEPLDRYARELVSVRAETCRADISDDRRAARLACLDRRLFELGGAADAIVHAPTRERARARPANLPAVAPCVEAKQVRMPTSPAQLVAIESITTRFLRVQDKYYASTQDDADLAEIERLERESEQTGDLELQIRIMRMRGSFLRHVSRLTDAKALYLAAYDLAVKHAFDTAAVEAIIDVAKVAVSLQDLNGADSYTRTALALLEKPENANPRIRMRLYQGLAQLAMSKADVPNARRYLAEARTAMSKLEVPDAKDQLSLFEMDESRIDELDGKYERALQHITLAEKLTREFAGDRHPNVADVLGMRSQTLARMQRYREARQAKQAQVDLLTQIVPPTHSKLLGAREGLAIAAIRDHDLEGGIKLYEEALERAKGNPVMLANRPTVYHNLAGAHWDLGRRDRGRELEQLAVDDAERQWGPKHLEVATKLLQLAEFESDLGNYARAEAHFDRADPILALLRADHPYRIRLAASRIELLRKQHDLRGAQQLVTQTLQLLDERKVDDHGREGIWSAAGQVLLEKHDWHGARVVFERVLQSRQSRGALADDIALAEFFLGWAEYALGERDAGLTRIRRARPVLDRPTRSDSRALVRAWARANRVTL